MKYTRGIPVPDEVEIRPEIRVNDVEKDRDMAKMKSVIYMSHNNFSLRTIAVYTLIHDFFTSFSLKIDAPTMFNNGDVGRSTFIKTLSYLTKKDLMDMLNMSKVSLDRALSELSRPIGGKPAWMRVERKYGDRGIESCITWFDLNYRPFVEPKSKANGIFHGIVSRFCVLANNYLSGTDITEEIENNADIGLLEDNYTSTDKRSRYTIKNDCEPKSKDRYTIKNDDEPTKGYTIKNDDELSLYRDSNIILIFSNIFNSFHSLKIKNYNKKIFSFLDELYKKYSTNKINTHMVVQSLVEKIFELSKKEKTINEKYDPINYLPDAWQKNTNLIKLFHEFIAMKVKVSKYSAPSTERAAKHLADELQLHGTQKAAIKRLTYCLDNNNPYLVWQKERNQLKSAIKNKNNLLNNPNSKRILDNSGKSKSIVIVTKKEKKNEVF